MSQLVPPRPDQPGSPVPPQPEGAPSVTWRWWEAVVVYLLGLLTAGVVTLPVLRLVEPASAARLAAAAASDVVIVAVLLLWLRALHPGWRRALGIPPRLWPELRAGLIFGVGLYPVAALVVGAAFGLLLRALTGEPVPTPEQLPADLPGSAVALAVPFALVVAPVAEELFFRGVLFRAIRDRYGFGVGAAASALVFGLVHYVEASWASALLLMSVMVVTGLGLAFLYERRGNILAPIAAHAAFNLVGLVLILGA